MIEDKTEEFSLELKKDAEGKYFFKAISLTHEFEKIPCLERLAKDSLNKHLVWRHRHPINDKHNHAHIFGSVTKSEVVNGRIESTYLPYDHTKLHEDFIEEIKEKNSIGDPVGVSMRYRKYYDNNGIIKHLDVFEHSVTPFPKCVQCLQIDEYIGENIKMSEDKNETETPEIIERLKKIEELESALNSKTEVLEDYKTRVETLEKEIQENKTLEDEIKSLEEKLEEQRSKFEGVIDYLKKKPILEELFEIRDLDDEEKEFYKTRSLEKLVDKRDKWLKEINTPVTQTIEESANEVKASNKEEDEKNKPLTEEKINEFVKDERLRRIMLKQLKKEV